MPWHVFSWFCVLSLRVAIRYSGGYCAGVLPLPIPNREVKPGCADGTAMQCGRVGGRLLLRVRDVFLRKKRYVPLFFVCVCDVVDYCLQCYRLSIFIYILFANILLYGIK